MDLNEVFNKAGKRRQRKRRGRGPGSGIGGTSGRGEKGAKSRAGYSRRYGYEGGQMSIIRRTPKRGFSNAIFRRRYDVINLDALEAHFEDGARIELTTLVERRLVRASHGKLKVLGDGELKKSLTVVAAAVSGSARQKIEAAGGTVEVLPRSSAKAGPPAGKPEKSGGKPEKKAKPGKKGTEGEKK